MVTYSDPPNPFSDSDIAGVIYRLYESGDLVEPDDDPQALYVLILPPGVSFSKPNVIGEHSFFRYLDLTGPQLPPDFDAANAHYAWVRSMERLTLSPRSFPTSWPKPAPTRKGRRSR